MGDENDLLNFFNKQDKLKTVPVKKAAAVAPPPPKKEEVVEVKEQKPTKAVQDLRALRYDM
jgi:hypothetical protein